MFILEEVFNLQNKYVQGYYQYDSKKSGGITISHLRISDEKINAPYYVTNPNTVILTKETYLGKYDILSGKDKSIKDLLTKFFFVSF